MVGKRSLKKETRQEVIRLHGKYLADPNCTKTDDPVLRHHAYYQWLQTNHPAVVEDVDGPDKMKRIAHWIDDAGL